MRRQLEQRIADGLPDLDPDLSWPGTNVHLSGFATALRLGPTAGNLVGHRRAAVAAVTAWLSHDPPGRPQLGLALDVDGRPASR